ncbi:Inner membrane protein YjcH [compost metagenome]
MNDPVVAKIQANPRYQELKRKRNAFGWTLTILMLVVYYGYIGLIAFDKEFLAMPLGTGVTTLGIPIALGVIIFTVLITGIYVRRANTEYDAMTQQILKDVAQ